MKIKRTPDETRELLLDAAFHEIYFNGFQGASLTTILAKTNLTKGALYHHFKNKKALGYAVIDECFPKKLDQIFFRPLRDEDDFFAGYERALLECDPEWKRMLVRYGSPGFKLAQEMSHLDEGFQNRLDRIFKWWRDGIAETIRSAQKKGQIKADIIPQEQAFVLQSFLLGGLSLAKVAQDQTMLTHTTQLFLNYLETLRATDGV
ncbi:MAG: TetR/AcrR family transcriptional regulator [Magnetococcales bacterium]|nr:TetR/AcrR family transcriptional regulator [Magnetococcales bacterium]